LPAITHKPSGISLLDILLDAGSVQIRAFTLLSKNQPFWVTILLLFLLLAEVG
jgi:hypothetical protein